MLAGYVEQIIPHKWYLIIPMPTYVGEGGRDFDHIDLIVERRDRGTGAADPP